MGKTDQTQQIIKSVMDTTSLGVLVGSMVELLPAISAVFTIVWIGIRIYETDTVQKIFKRDKK